MPYSDGDRVTYLGKPHTVIGSQHGRYVGIKSDDSNRVRTVDRQGFGTSGVDYAVPADSLTPFGGDAA